MLSVLFNLEAFSGEQHNAAIELRPLTKRFDEPGGCGLGSLLDEAPEQTLGCHSPAVVLIEEWTPNAASVMRRTLVTFFVQRFGLI